MKRKIYALAAVFVSSLFLTACGSKEYLKDIKAEKYVTLGNYVGIEASADMMEITDDDVESYINKYFLEAKAEIVPVTGRPVQEGDTANIDFVGYQDGVAFEGGTAAGFDLTIGSGQFIDGFEAGLIGVEIGQQVSLNLRFPDPYTNPDLAGQPVVFEVTVNSISEKQYPELTDEIVQQLIAEGYNVGQCQTAQELHDWIYDLYHQYALSLYESEIEAQLADAIMGTSTFQDPPEEMVERFTHSMRNSTSSGAVSSEDGRQMTKMYIMYQAIADEEGLNPTEEEFAEEISEIMTIYGYASEEELKENVDEEALKEDIMRENVVAFLKENGNIQ